MWLIVVTIYFGNAALVDVKYMAVNVSIPSESVRRNILWQETTSQCDRTQKVNSVDMKSLLQLAYSFDLSEFHS
jgi:hypothetical protein